MLIVGNCHLESTLGEMKGRQEGLLDFQRQVVVASIADPTGWQDVLRIAK